MAKCPYEFLVRGTKDSPVYSRVDYSKSPDMIRGILVPCGKCMICRKNRAAEWAMRITHEIQYHTKSCFVTLTYDDSHLPVSSGTLVPTLYKRHLQLFFKRLRSSFPECKIKYFACGEYGKHTLRPHYHAIIMGFQPPLSDLIKVGTHKGRDMFSSSILGAIWTDGYVQVGSADPGSIYYTTGYIIKQLHKSKLSDRVPEFLLCSRGIGLRYALDHKDKVLSCSLTAEGVQAPLPRYYVKKIGIDRSVVVSKSLVSDRKTIEHYVSRGVKKRSQLKQRVKEARLQGLKDEMAKASLTDSDKL